MPDQCAFDFTGRTVIVTGAARGLGAAITTAFAAAGADVLAVDLDPEVDAAATTAGARAMRADVSATSDVDAVVQVARERHGRIDVLVNGAGILRDRVLWKLEDADWEAVIGVHLTGAFKLTRACVPTFREQVYGRVVNVTSYTGLHGNVGQIAYASAKAGIIGLTKTSAKELARFGVTVNAISPNARTRMVEGVPPEKYKELEAMIPVGRFAEPEEIADTVLFLSSSNAAYLTGAVVPIDGGLSM